MVESRKKRWSRGWVLLGVVMAIPLGWLAWAVWWAMTAQPAPRVSYAPQIAELARSTQPEGENGWPAFLKTCEIYVRMEEELDANEVISEGPRETRIDFDRALQRPYRPEDWAPELEALEYLREHGAWDRLREAVEAPNAVREDFGRSTLIAMTPEGIPEARDLTRACAVRLRIALHEGDTEEAERAMADLVGLSRIVGTQPTLIHMIVDSSIRAMALRRVQLDLHDLELDESTSRRLLNALEREPGPWTRLETMVEGEQLCALDIIQQFFCPRGRLLFTEAAILDPAVPSLPRVANVAGLLLPRRDRIEAIIAEYFQRTKAHVELSPAERPRVAAGPDDWLESQPSHDVLLDFLIPPIQEMMPHFDRLTVEDAGTRGLLLLEIHHARHGEFPATLNDLDDDLGTAFPLDPLHGKPFRYRRLNPGDDERGRRFLLYSQGLDEEDNGGRMPAGLRDAAAALTDPVQGAGFDFVINSVE